MGAAKWLIRIGGGLSLTSLVVIAFLSLAQRIEERPRYCPPGQWCSGFVGYTHFLVLGLDIAPDVFQPLLALLPVFAVFGVSLIVAGLMMKGGKTHSNRSST
jgi:ABC-type Na+ efflux pump permease subunit